ncbi:MAG: helix-turn-helix domain-containing protein [Bacteroidota bacterium]|jgi:cytoskeletal protein RodZ
MKPPGEQLRRAREAQGRSLEDIAAATRINRKYLQQLEDGIQPDLPETYVRAFVKGYAGQLGLSLSDISMEGDRDPQRSDRTDGGSPAPQEGRVLAEMKGAALPGSPSLPAKANKGRQVNVLLLLAILVIAGLTLSLLWMQRGRKSESVQELSFTQVVKDQERRQKPGDKAVDSYLSSASRPSSGVTPDSLVLEAASSESVWVRIVADGVLAKEYSLAPHNHVRMKAKDYFLLSLDNARAVSFFLNGKRIGELNRNRKPLYNITLSWKTFQELQKNGAGTE